MEQWRDVPSQPALQASSLGRVRVKRYTKPMPYGGHRTYGGRPTFGQWDGARYTYNRAGKHKTLKVARLVCEAFHGLPPADRPNCLHKDEDARNNKAINLKWGTQKENLNYPKFINYCKSRTGQSNPYVKGRKVR